MAFQQWLITTQCSDGYGELEEAGHNASHVQTYHETDSTEASHTTGRISLEVRQNGLEGGSST